MASIYGLFDQAGRLKYIGKAECPKRRLKKHMAEIGRRRTPLYSWLAKHGEPEMRVLERDCQDWREAERRLIREARERGDDLLNLADGGDEPFCSTEQRRHNAQALNARYAADPVMEFIRNAKRTLGQALVRGDLSERAKASMRLCAVHDPKRFGAWTNV